MSGQDTPQTGDHPVETPNPTHGDQGSSGHGTTWESPATAPNNEPVLQITPQNIPGTYGSPGNPYGTLGNPMAGMGMDPSSYFYNAGGQFPGGFMNSQFMTNQAAGLDIRTATATGMFTSPGASPLEQSLTSNKIIQGQHHALLNGQDDKQNMALGGGAVGALAGAGVGSKLHLGAVGLLGGLAIGAIGGYLGGNAGGAAWRSFKETQGGKDAVWNDAKDYKLGNGTAQLAF